MEWFKIDGISYNVIVESIEENFTILYGENSGRTLDEGAPMVLDPLGTFFGHVVVVKRKNGYERHFDALYRAISRPTKEGFEIDIVHFQDVVRYKGYISNGGKKLVRIDEKSKKVYWDSLTLNIVPMSAQVTPNNEQDIDQVW
jgi:hypothetical protein